MCSPHNVRLTNYQPSSFRAASALGMILLQAAMLLPDDPGMGLHPHLGAPFPHIDALALFLVPWSVNTFPVRGPAGLPRPLRLASLPPKENSTRTRSLHCIPQVQQTLFSTSPGLKNSRNSLLFFTAVKPSAISPLPRHAQHVSFG